MTNTQSPYTLGAYYQSQDAHPYQRIFKVTEVHDTHTVLVEVGSTRYNTPIAIWHNDPRQWIEPLTPDAIRSAYNEIARDLDGFREKVLRWEKAQDELTKALDATNALHRPEQTAVDEQTEQTTGEN